MLSGPVVVTSEVKAWVGPLFARLNTPHYESCCNQFSSKLQSFNQVKKLHHLLHVSAVGSLRPAIMALRDVVDVALNYRVALFEVEPSGVPSFQRGIQWYINVLAGHPIPELQVHAANNLGTTVPFFLQTEQVPEEVEVRKNT